MNLSLKCIVRLDTFHAFKSKLMQENRPTCVRCVGEKSNPTSMIRWGRTGSGNQRYKCRRCGHSRVEHYVYKAYLPQTENHIVNFLKEGCGILSISRLLRISPNTVQKRILEYSSKIKRPTMAMKKEYELDEMCTYIGRKLNTYWIAYAIRKDNRQVVDFRIGKRTNKTLRPIIETLHLSNATVIYTDKLKNYRYLIQKAVHKTKSRGTNYIERHNLTIRTRLKRLSRRTICFPRSLAMLKVDIPVSLYSPFRSSLNSNFQVLF